MVGCEQSLHVLKDLCSHREERYLFLSFAWKLFGCLVMSRTLVNYSDVASL